MLSECISLTTVYDKFLHTSHIHSSTTVVWGIYMTCLCWGCIQGVYDVCPPQGESGVGAPGGRGERGDPGPRVGLQ